MLEKRGFSTKFLIFLIKINSYRTMVITIMDEMVCTELSPMKREGSVGSDCQTMVSEYL